MLAASCVLAVLSSAYPIRKLTLGGLHMDIEADTEPQPTALSTVLLSL